MSLKIQLYSMATPNGRKASIALEEMELPYDAHMIDIRKGDQKTEEYLAMNPNGKIPVIVDPDGPGGKEITLMESGAILIYLAEKSGKFLSKDPIERSRTLQWLFFQVGHVGPMFGQFGHFYAHQGKEECDHPYPLERYTNESKRLLGILNDELGKRPYITGEEYSIADIAIFPWVGALDWAYNAVEYFELEQYKDLMDWHERCSSRPAAQRGSVVCAPN